MSTAIGDSLSAVDLTPTTQATTYIDAKSPKRTVNSIPSSRKSLLSRTEAWLRYDLTALNAAVEKGEVSPTEFVERVAPLLQETSDTFRPLLPRLPAKVRRRLARNTGFLVGSAERHFQISGRPAGTTWQFVPGAEWFTYELTTSLGLPPAMSIYAYWLDNTDGYSFTGEPGEVAFGEVVRRWDDNCKAAGDALRPIALGQIQIDSPDSADAIATAAESVEEISSIYEVLRKREDGTYGLTFEVFNRMRNYLCGWRVCGQFSTGPNAANLQSQWSLDLLGIGMDGYGEIIADRMQFLMPEDREIVYDDMALPSVPERFLDRLSLTRREAVVADVSTIADRILDQPPPYRRALIEYSRFHRAIVKLSAKHWQSIDFILIKSVERITPEELAKLPVPPTQSVGGADHSRPKGIFDMRRNDPVVVKLMAALNLVTARMKKG